MSAQRIDAGGDIEQHALDDGAGQILRRGIGPGHPVQGAGCLGQIRGALAVEIGQQGESAGPGLGGQRQLIQPVEVHPEHRGTGIEHAGRIKGAHQREVATGRIGEGGDRPRLVRDGVGSAGEDRPAGPERAHHIAGLQAQTQGGPHIVAGPRRHKHS